MLRHLEHDRFEEAFRAFKRCRGEPEPPPAALARLGRRLIELGHARRACLVLRRLVELYPAHEDGTRHQRDLALALARAGKVARARELLARPDVS